MPILQTKKLRPKEAILSSGFTSCLELGPETPASVRDPLFSTKAGATLGAWDEEVTEVLP